MQIHSFQNGTIYVQSDVNVRGKMMKILTYNTEGDKEQLLIDHENNLTNREVIYFQTEQMHKEIANGENGNWSEDMQKMSRIWLSKM